jgi:Z1 domain-containing protein
MADSDQAPVERIEVQKTDGVGERWIPSVGREALSVLDSKSRLTQQEKDTVINEAVGVLRECVPPRPPPRRRTGLAIGQVQSGKTLSFTTVAALARDNDYRLVVVLAGTSQYLQGQSEERLYADLKLGNRRWRHFSSPDATLKQKIDATLEEWRDVTADRRRLQAVLVTVMKNHVQLRDLRAALGGIRLDDVPVLIVDDEADQAGLNTMVNRGDESATYAGLRALRAMVPHHTYLQYTATPQGPLLINIIDSFSPDFFQLLTPGGDYTGGRVFFRERVNDLVEPILGTDIPSANNILTSPPSSLLGALRIFYLGVAAGAHRDEDPEPRNRSMMIHPSQRVMQHAQFRAWVQNTQTLWANILRRTVGDPDRADLVDEFRGEYDDLATTISDLPSFEDLLRHLHLDIAKTSITEINTPSNPPPIDWDGVYAHILIGGQALDRGFTVEGLTVTYMPRGIGVGHADTIQQRARFFGYKRKYLGYCRIYLETQTLRAYQRYVEHEESILERLRAHQKTGRSLKEWRRIFFLDPALRPTRNSIIDIPLFRGNIGNDWWAPSFPHDLESSALSANRALVEDFVRKQAWLDRPGPPQLTPTQRHKYVRLPLKTVYEDLVERFQHSHPVDSNEIVGLLLAVGRYLDNHLDAICTVYWMGAEDKERRHRTAKFETGEVENWFQGANLPHYPGDVHVRSDDELTVQIRRMDVHRKPTADSNDGQPWVKDVPVLTIWIPRAMATAWVRQPQPN